MVRTANLPLEIHQIFVQVLAREISLLDFEQWLYGKKELEEILPEKTYLGLLELNYQDQSTFFELAKLLKEFIDPGSVEAYELRKLIQRLEAERADFPQALQECYDLYADGCYFLEKLGLKWGLLLRVPPAQFHADSWDELSDSERVELLNLLDRGEIRKEVNCFRQWIENREIIVIKRPNEFPRYEYIDRRPEVEKPCSDNKT